MAEDVASPIATGLQDRGDLVWLYVLALMAAVAVGVLVRLAVLAPLDADEVEHGHAAWLIATGHRPYLDFHQIHMPLAWLVAAPLAALVSTPSILIVSLRLLCIAALLAALVLAYSATAGSMERRDRLIAALVATIWAAAFAAATQIYRFRPDPFMAAAVMGAVATYARPGFASLRRHGVAGCCLGLATVFSPKMLPLILLAPAVAVLDLTIRPRWLARAAAACTAAAAGAVIAPLLLVAVLGAMGLLQPFYFWVVTQNATMVNTSMTKTHSVILLVILGAAVVAGAAATSWRWWQWGRDAARPLAVVSAALVFGALVPIVEPNHLMYNYQTALVPASLAVGLAIAALTSSRDRRKWRQLAVTLGLMLVCAIPLVANWQIRELGMTPTLVSANVLDKLSHCGDWSHDTCIGFAPHHPMSCPDATALTQMWDYSFMIDFPLPESTRAVYAAMWRDAIPRMVAAPPALVVRPKLFRLVADQGRLDATSYATLQHLFAARYRQGHVAGAEVMVRNDRVACLDP